MRKKPSPMSSQPSNKANGKDAISQASQMSYPAYLKSHLEANSRERQVKKNGSNNFME